jgi:class 3 adenylate cyclase/DNA-binding transcriptional MerR regulator
MNVKPEFPDSEFISSKEILEKIGISRVTLHNYIKLGLIPRPIIGPPQKHMKKTRKIGYFPSEVIEKIALIDKYKKMGHSLATISREWRENNLRKKEEISKEEEMEQERITQLAVANLGKEGRFQNNQRTKYSPITEIGYPAYMVNRRWEIEWVTPSAEELFFSQKVKDLPTSEERNIFRLFLKNLSRIKINNIEQFIALNAELASSDIPSPSDNPTLHSLPSEDLALLNRLWKKRDDDQKSPMEKMEVTLDHSVRGRKNYNLICCAFREGTLILLVPAEILFDRIIDTLLGRERVVRDLMLNKMPSFCSLCVLVSDLQDSVKISADLPPAEYFELVSQIWSKMETSFRKYHGTQGKHVGDGVVRFFLAEPESAFRHVLNALICGYEIKRELSEINSEWKIRKKWTNELYFNIGVHEGREWFGYIPNQFTALGDTVNIAGRLSDFARDGTVWVSKHSISLLPPEIQQKLAFGIPRSSSQGEMFVANTFSRVMDLVDLSKPESAKFVDIATLSVTELIEIDQNL